MNIPAIARDVGCSPQNLRQSKKFMESYKAISGPFERPPGGSMTDGFMEAW